MKPIEDLLGDNYGDLFEDVDSQNVVWAMKEMMDEVDRKLEDNLSTWEKMMESEDFRRLPRKTRILIWELVKIKENDSPKNQTAVADQYDVSDARLSQIKQKIDDLGF
jgi:hypothetical protein